MASSYKVKMIGLIPLLLESCSSSPASSASVPQLIAWQSEDMPTGTYSSLVDTFNKLNSDGIHVSYTQNGDALHEQLQQGFSAQSRTPDVVSLDVIWVDEFASKGWLLPLDDRWTEQERTQYVPAGLNAASSQGHIWAAPFRLDVGLLYYRTDIVTTAPKTWDEAELTAILANSQLRPRSAHYQEISMAIQTYISKALTKSLAPADALEALQRALDNIVANNS